MKPLSVIHSPLASHDHNRHLRLCAHENSLKKILKVNKLLQALTFHIFMLTIILSHIYVTTLLQL